ncbi:MAG: glycosyltransferase family 9 protein, partial [Candidatus Binatia bacterium]
MTASDGEPRLDLGPVRRILVVKLSSLGDIVHATPCLRALRGRFPEAEIVVAIERRFADVLRKSRYADTLVEAEARPAGIVRGYLEGRGALARLKPFDLAIDLQGLGRSAGWVYASRARVAAGRGRIRPGWRVASTPPLDRHAVEVSASVLGDLGIPVGSLRPEISTSAAAERALAERLASLGVETAGYLVVNPFSRWPSKAWPIERWAELIPWLAAAAGTVLLSGGPDEEA